MRLKLIVFLVVFISNSITYTTFSQEMPPINTFSTEDYGAENQNWGITQTSNKFIYVANNAGLLEFNGSNWNLYPTPNESIMRSVKSMGNKVYSGFYKDFGYWESNHSGVLEFTSMVTSNNIEMLEDEQIWQIEELDGWLLFKSLQRIYLYNLESKQIQIINSEKTITILSKLEGTIYFQEIGKGLFKIENGSSKLVSGNELFKEKRIIEMFYKDEKQFFLTEKDGFYYLQNNQLIPWVINSNELLSKNTIYSAQYLKNGNLVLGTISNGLIYLQNNGDLIYQITQTTGLSNNTVLSIFEDVDNNIWLGLDNGINTINLSSPFKLFVNKDNYWGTIYSTIVYKNNLYIGTNQGLYFKKRNSKDAFQFIKNTAGQVWNLTEVNNTLFCNHNSGTFIIDDGRASLIPDTYGTWSVKRINDSTILQGSYYGLHILVKQANKWIHRNKINGFSNSSRQFIIKDKNTVFVNHEYKGVFKLKIDKDFKNILEIEKDESVKKGIHSGLIKIDDDVLYSSKKGVYRFSEINNTFEIDTVYSKLIPENLFLSAKLILHESTKKLWSFTEEDIRCLSPGKLSKKPIFEIIPIKRAFIKGASGFENIIHLEGKKYLLGTSNGYLTIDLSSKKESVDFSIKIDKVLNNKIDDVQKRVSLIDGKEFESNRNNFEFFYSVPNFSKTSSVKYQHKLEGLNEKWSVSSGANSTLYENLPSGNYVFKVRAYKDNKLCENVEEYSFIVLKPWYKTNVLKATYLIILLFIMYLLHVASKKYYKKQREDLLRKAQNEMELKELENSQKIIKLNNDKLRSDITSKNRELASSTMSIIKKNEFLSTIKSELIDGGNDKVNKVIKIIDKNLKNTDDWKLFQEAFNNADKKFLKKIKSKHDNLTPNDLRLCAYLRLNLSSKEISPLLNISPRSVEVKRYRLRKKMNLPHDANLTTYILEI
ncbi:triple tyrosine motif-containing protein [uncultured Polaribacter sp.]|uniref:triple tyrosine motif-containing protein n=1 Tax=uncultured Polaribacter sp. TaxID=174711 RepID=UPI002611A2BF|nr:triple tyrosine motif-containing protein [uncultured Polaribacter sp.]